MGFVHSCKWLKWPRYQPHIDKLKRGAFHRNDSKEITGALKGLISIVIVIRTFAFNESFKRVRWCHRKWQFFEKLAKKLELEVILATEKSFAYRIVLISCYNSI